MCLAGVHINTDKELDESGGEVFTWRSAMSYRERGTWFSVTLYLYFRRTGPFRRADFRIADAVNIRMHLSFVTLTISVPR